MTRFRRLELWSDLQCAGGVRLAVVPDLVALSDRRLLSGDDEIAVRLPTRSVAWSSAREGRVIRALFVDDAGAETFDEYRVVGVDEQNGARDPLVGDLAGAAVLQDLARTVIARVEADGQVVHDFEALRLTPAEHLATFVLPALAAEGWTHFAAGTVDPSSPVDVVYDWDTPLAVCRRLAEAAGCEFRVRRGGTTQYLIDLVTQVGAGATTVGIRLRKNLRGVQRKRSAVEQATRVYPRGVDVDGIRATMARARWKVAAVSGTLVTLADPAGGDGPVAFDDQLNGLYLRTAGGALTLVGDTIRSTQQVDVASAAGIAVNDLVEFRRDASGTLLTYLEAPSQRTMYGLRSATIDRPEVGDAVNVVANPAMRAWAGLATDPPDSWAKLGAPTLTRTTTGSRWQKGGRSCRVVSSADGQGLETNYVAISPTTDAPYFSGFVSFWIESGRVRVELVATDGVTSWVLPDGTDGLAYSTNTKVWVDLGVAGIDLKALGLGATQVKIRVVQDGPGTADFYVDSAQVTQSAGQLPFVEGSGGTQLWQAANEELLRRADPSVAYQIDVIDLARGYGSRFPDDALTVGGPVSVRDDQLGVVASTRFVEIRRDLLEALTSSVVLSNRPEDLTDELVRPVRAPRKVRGLDAATALTVEAQVNDVAQTPNVVSVRLASRPAGSAVYYVIQASGAPVPAIGSSSWTLYAGPFTVTQSPTADQQVSSYAQLGGRYSEVFTRLVSRAATPSVAVSLGEDPVGTLTISWTPTGDVQLVALYRKKNGAGNGWPTTNNNVDGPLDTAQFLGRFHPTADGGGWDASGNLVAGRLSFAEAGYAASDVAKVILVGLDKNGVVTARAPASRTMTGLTPRLTAFSAAKTANGTSCVAGAQITVSWTPNAAVVNATHDLRIYRAINGGPAVLVKTEASPLTTTSYVDTVEDYAGTGPTYTWTYSYELVAAGTPVDSGAAADVSIQVSGHCPIYTP